MEKSEGFKFDSLKARDRDSLFWSFFFPLLFSLRFPGPVGAGASGYRASRGRGYLASRGGGGLGVPEGTVGLCNRQGA